MPTRKLLRMLLLAAGWLLLLAALCGPHTSWSVCLTGHCRHQAAAAAPRPAAHGCCCGHDAPARAELRLGEEGNDASCPHGCCVDFMIALENGPLPTMVAAPDLTPPLVALLPAPADEPATAGANAARHAFDDTGPPRPDAKTALRATTVLRE
ncbi:MAG: hypothetical protein U1E73_00380 [Planctomycetota bacterium]